MAKNKNPWRRRLLILLALAFAIFVIAVMVRPQPVPADFAVVSQEPLVVTLDEEGETRVRDRFVVSAPVAGRLLRIELEPGDVVRAGETALATFQPSAPSPLDARESEAARARVDAARAALGRAKADAKTIEAELAFAKTHLERQKRLASESVVSAEALDQARLDAEREEERLSAARFAIRAAEHDLKAARAQLMQATGSQNDVAEPLVLTAPVDGVVLRRLRESESVVPAGEPLLEVGDSERLEIISDFLSIDAVKIEAGQSVRIEQWGGDQPLQGRVRRVEPSGFTKISALGVEEQRVNIIVDVEDSRETWKALGDGFRVEVRVVIWSGENVLQVPTSALFRHDEGWALFAVTEASTAELRPVEIGHRNGLRAEILDGLREGEHVVVHPSDAVVDGAPLAARDV